MKDDLIGESELICECFETFSFFPISDDFESPFVSSEFGYSLQESVYVLESGESSDKSNFWYLIYLSLYDWKIESSIDDFYIPSSECFRYPFFTSFTYTDDFFCMTDDIFSDREIYHFCHPSNKWIVMYEKSRSMLDMYIGNISPFCNPKSEPTGWSKANM
jgi:hypothetical protein